MLRIKIDITVCHIETAGDIIRESLEANDVTRSDCR